MNTRDSPYCTLFENKYNEHQGLSLVFFLRCIYKTFNLLDLSINREYNVKTYRKWEKGLTMKLKTFGAVVLTLTICALATFSSMAYVEAEPYVPTGPATGLSCEDYNPDLQQIAGSGGLVNAVPCEDGTFLFEGKKYIIDSEWGEHCLTGYAATGNCTASGKMPTLYHTVSGPKAMLGKVCLIKGSYMLNGKTGDVSKYDGIYVFEDTGGAAVEYGTERTMNTPVVDIYRETFNEAIAVTQTGTIVADVYILREVQ